VRRVKNQLPADTTNVVGIGLSVVVRVAIVKIHVEGVGGIIGIGSGRPVVVGNGT